MTWDFPQVLGCHIKMKKKVLFVGRFAPPMHGAAKMNDLYFEALKKDKNFEVRKIKLNKYDSLDNIGKIDKKKIKGYFETIKEFKRELKKFNPDIVYIEMAPRGIGFLKDSVFVNIAKRKGRKVFIQFHAKGAKHTTKNIFLRQYYKKVFRNTKIILLSKILFDDIKRVAKIDQVEILPNGIGVEINDKEFEKIIKERKKNKKPHLLFLSNMIESKGPMDVLKICNELNKEKIDFECNFVGKFQDEEFKVRFEKQLVNFKLDKKCKYLGPRYGEDKKKILEKTDFLIFPTKYEEECFPIVILESFMLGIPAFSYNNGAVGELISEDYLGFVSKENDWKEIRRELMKRFGKKIDYNKIRENFKKRFLLEDSMKKIKEILR